MDYQVYQDKVYGGWLGKCLGGAAGAPVEGIKAVIPNEHYSEVFRADLPNDDLDLQLLWLEVLQKKGFGLTAHDMAEAWKNQCWYPFSEYGYFLKNYERGIEPPTSGWFNNPLFCEGEGSPIRSEIWAMCFPGKPELAARYAALDSSLDHAGASVWIEQYYAAIEAQVFVEDDLKKILKDQIHYLPENSRARLCMESVMEFYEKYPQDWLKARTNLMRRFGHHEFTNSIVNLGLVAIALLYGEGDLDKTINIAFRSGFDADCTCATAGSIIGILLGESGISEDLKKLVDDQFVIGIDVERTDNSIRTLTEETCVMGVLAQKIGGISIQNVPEGLAYPTWPEKEACVELHVEYENIPAVGIGESCGIRVTVQNDTKEEKAGVVYLANLPEKWTAEPQSAACSLMPGETKTFIFTVSVPEGVERLENTNLMEARFKECAESVNGMYGTVVAKNVDVTKSFGIAGASIWRAAGPFFEAMDRPDPEGVPSAHGEGCVLPTIESMVNNEVFLDKEYIDETNISQSISAEDTIRVAAYEDMLPMDEVFSFKGQGCIYLEQIVESPEDRELWAVIGNNDGFRMWVNGQQVIERDEIRLWTPYNNCKSIFLKKGENRIVLKLLRRTESLKFSFGLRRYEGQHWHRKKWYTDFASVWEEK